MDYGAVASLKQTIDRLLHSPQSLIVLQNSEIESLSEQLLHLQSFLDTIKLLTSSERIDASLERRIKDAANEFADLIDFHISDLSLSGSDQSSSLTSAFSQQLQKVNREFTSLTLKLMNDEEDQYQQMVDYGAVASLKQTIERLLLRSPQSEIVVSNYDVVCYMGSFLGTIKLLTGSDWIDPSSERRIKDAANEFEDLIHFRFSELFLSGSDQSSSFTSAFSQQLQKVNRELTSLTLKLMNEYQQMDYGVVASLKQTIERLVRSTQSEIVVSNYDGLCYMRSFLDAVKWLPSSNKVDASSKRRVKDAAKEFEDLIDSLISDLFISDESSSLKSAFNQQLLKVNQEIASLTQKFITDEDEDEYQQMDYGVVASVKQTIERLLLRSPQSEIVLSNSGIESKSKGLLHLHSFLDAVKLLPSSNRVDASARRRVKDAAKEFQDLIDSHISDLFLSDETSNLMSAFNQQLLKVNREIALLTQKFVIDQHQQPSDDSFGHDGVPQLRIDLGEEKKMGSLHEKLTSWISTNGTYGLSVMVITGMAGIGKTTLARQVFNHPGVVDEFDCYSFVSASPKSRLEEIQLLVLRGMCFNDGRKADEIFLNIDNGCSLGDLLHRTLSKNSYLIVLDNMWNTQVWDQLRLCFPDDKNGSRVILTSRLLDFHREGDWETFMEIPLLNADESWNLLHKLVFTAEERCSRQLEKIGREIAKNCEGLPLAIIEVGKLLRKIEKTIENWTTIAESEDPITITRDDNTPLSEALSLSYMMLPQYLKVCFLYMAVFPKKYKIPRLKLISLWTSEGILEPEENKSLEETAEECLNILVSQSVVFSNEFSTIGTKRSKTCRLHFTFRNLCSNEANTEKFFYIIKKYKDDNFPEKLSSQNRLCFHNNIVLGFIQVHSWMESIPNARSLLCFGPKQPYPIALYLGFRLLKVLDAILVRFYEFPHQVLKLVHLKYLAITCDGEIPSSVSCLWNLEVLIVHQHHNIKRSNLPVYLPIEIWKLHKLKHLQCMGLDLPDPTSTDDDSLILEKLLTLSGVSAHSCTVGVLGRIPNLMKIGIKIESAPDSVETFNFLGGDHFASLYEAFESFKCVVVAPSLMRSPEAVSSIPINFPVNVRKITLSGCGFPWEYMSVVAELPNLEVLKLQWYSFCGPFWRICKNEFRKLKFLLLQDLDLEFLKSGRRHFPALERLIIRHCYKLEMVSLKFAIHGSLELIELDDCTKSFMYELRDEFWNIGKFNLRLRIHSSDEDKELKS